MDITLLHLNAYLALASVSNVTYAPSHQSVVLVQQAILETHVILAQLDIINLLHPH